MADDEPIEILMTGVEAWNKWRYDNPGVQINLRGAPLDGADLEQANLAGEECDLTHAFLHDANLCGAHLSGAKVVGTNLCQARLCGADLIGADLHRANLDRADLTGADLSNANLERTILVRTKVSQATFTGCRVYGASAWDLDLTDVRDQSNLRITREDEPGRITVDNLQVAQFVYLLLHNEKIRNVIDTITSKAVLILGRFSPERKIILDRLREELRRRNYVPIMFDFEKAKSRDTVETIRILAGMAKFVIADLTDAKSVLQELQAIVPNLPSVAVRFIMMKAQLEPGMLDHIRHFPWVVQGAFEYENAEEVIASIKDSILDPVEAKLRELA
jgi:uncharacterized protein YjbI with pentapeptide repeats